jgi:hypothetical protein
MKSRHYHNETQEKPSLRQPFGKKAGSWDIEHTASHQLLYWLDSFVLLKPLLRLAPQWQTKNSMNEWIKDKICLK